jgi:hypothetical protein
MKSRTLMIAVLMAVAVLETGALADQLIVNETLGGFAVDGGPGPVLDPWAGTISLIGPYADYNPAEGATVGYYNDATLISNVPFVGGYDHVNAYYVMAHDGQTGTGVHQVGFQSVTMSANMHYEFSADLRAWTAGVGGQTATASIRLFTLNGDFPNIVGGGWAYSDTMISWTATTSGDIGNWHHETVSFDIPAGFNLGTAQGVALWGADSGTPNAAGWAFDNISLVASPIPEPASMTAMLCGLAGALLLRRRM